jgi:hypothetical protein
MGVYRTCRDGGLTPLLTGTALSSAPLLSLRTQRPKRLHEYLPHIVRDVTEKELFVIHRNLVDLAMQVATLVCEMQGM